MTSLMFMIQNRRMDYLTCFVRNMNDRQVIRDTEFKATFSVHIGSHDGRVLCHKESVECERERDRVCACVCVFTCVCVCGGGVCVCSM